MEGVPLEKRKIAYFSMEIGIEKEIATYSGGLGVLAGDTLKAAADLGVPIVAITLLSEKGFFTQTIDENGWQQESPTEWNVKGKLSGPLEGKVAVQVEGREVFVQAWRHDIVGVTGHTIPVLFLDTNLPENKDEDRHLTMQLYGGDHRYRLLQEVVLGIGGIRLLHALGCDEILKYHMNEGHASLLSLDIFRTKALESGVALDNFQSAMEPTMNEVRKLCVFTTHTPVAAGHDKFPYDLVKQVLGEFVPDNLLRQLGGQDDLNMTLLALNLSHYVNSVARQHQYVSEHLFPGYRFSAITNGVHSVTWTAGPFARLFDRHMPNWRRDSFDLRYALRIPEEEIWMAHSECKSQMVEFLNKTHNAGFSTDTFTIGFARRATAYKRAHLLFQDIERLRKIASTHKIQILFAGKAHPKDTQGKEIIQDIHRKIGQLGDDVKIIYVPDYNMDIAKIIIPGVDVWLNTPARPQEASGTSGMKAAHNGVPHLSILDGWWVEGHIEGMTGWSIGPAPAEKMETINDDALDAQELYEKLERIILPEFYGNHKKWMHVMRNSIAFNASFFNTHRMVQQYVLNAYLF